MNSENNVNCPCPWRINNYDYGKGLIALHQEIEHFYGYIQSTAIEYEMRYSSIRHIEALIHQNWPMATVQVYGSFSTGLHLPESDIDVVVLGVCDTKEALFNLESMLRDSGVAVAASIVVLDKTVVPVVKYTDSETLIKFDISFNVNTGTQAAELVRDYKRIYPQMPRLVMVLKQFLKQHKMNEVYSGGISSYGLILMCIGFLKFNESGGRKLNKNFGVLLLKFLDYYGRKFDYYRCGITIKNCFGYMDKPELKRSVEWQCQSVLTIEDPFVPDNDIGRSSFGALQVKHLFETAYMKLSKIVDSAQTTSQQQGQHQSILACMINISTETLSYRNWARLTYKYLIKQKQFQQQYQYQNSSKKHKMHEQQFEEKENGFVEFSVTPYNRNTLVLPNGMNNCLVPISLDENCINFN